jgi:cytochrome b561
MHARFLAFAAGALLALCARAEPRLLQEDLHASVLASGMPLLDLSVQAAAQSPGGLDFDLLGEAPPAPQTESAAMGRRRWMMKTHQAVGMALLGTQLATTVVGQLNYNDKFAATPNNSNQYKTSHQVLAWANVSLFAINGGLGLFAPDPPGKKDVGFDRVKLHKWSMAVAAVGMLGQAALGLYTVSREGYENQKSYAQAHLVLGYTTLAAMGVGAGAIIF